MGNDVNIISSNDNNVKDKHYFINKDNQIRISVSNDNDLNSNTNTVNISESQANSNKMTEEQTKTYSLLPIDNNQDGNSNVNNIKKERKKYQLKKKKKKKIRNNPETFYKNICRKKSIIGICLNLFFWTWSFLLYLDHSSIITFPRASPDKKIDMVYGNNSDSFLGSFFSTLLYTLLNYLIITLYPEMLFFLSYIIYVVYSIYNTINEKFKENICLLSKNFYIFLVFLSFGEIYKLFARKYLDI